MLRDILRNAVLVFLPAKVSHRINVWKNITASFLEPEMPVLIDVLNRHPNRSNLSAIDIGANLGLFCHIFSRAGARVVAVEPQPRLASYLRKVVSLNVDVREVAVSNSTGFAKLRIPRIKGLLSSIGQRDAWASIERSNAVVYSANVETDEIEVSTTTLDHIAEAFPEVDFVKIDVEGHELAVLQGGQRLVGKSRTIFFIEIIKQQNSQAELIGDLFYPQGYKAYCCVNGSPVLLPTAAAFTDMLLDNIRDGVAVNNYFFVPPSRLGLFQSTAAPA